MAQFARPSSDVSTGSWTATPLWQKVDEATRSDADLITSADNSSGDTCELGLSSLTDPSLSTGHVLRYTYRKDATAGHSIDVRVKLMQGSTEIAQWLHSAVSATFVEAAQTLTATQANSITDYTDLRAQFIREGDTGGSPGSRRSAQTSWVEFEVPDAPVLAAASLSGSGSLSATTQLDVQAAASLSGSGDLTAAARQDASAAASLSGSGALTAQAFRAQFAAASLSGSGSLSADADHYKAVAAALSGSGSLIAAADHYKAVAAALSGSGSLIATARMTGFVAAALSGAGSLSVAAVLQHWTASAAGSGIWESPPEPAAGWTEGVVTAPSGWTGTPSDSTDWTEDAAVPPSGWVVDDPDDQSDWDEADPAPPSGWS